jgi:hypothetical protein
VTTDLTAWNDALKTHYDDAKKYELCDLMNPTLSDIPKEENFGGRSCNQSLIYQIAGGGSANIQKSITNALASIPEEFVAIPRKKLYEIALLDNETIEASVDDKDSYFRVLEETDRKYRAAANRVESRLYRGRGGWIGRIAVGTDITNAAVITLDDKADAFNFFKNQKITFSTTDGTSGSLLDSGEALTVASVSREAGTVTVTTDLDDIASITDSAYIFTDGDFGEGIVGFFDWVSFDRTILGTSFFGVTRSDDSDRLAGLYYDGTGEPYMEVLTRVVGILQNHMGGGGVQLEARCHPDVLTELVLSSQGKMIIDQVKVPSTRMIDLGYTAFSVTVGASKVTLKPTWACRTDRMLVTVPDIWKLKSTAGGVPKFLNRTGALHMMEDADTYQARIGGYYNLLCKAPGWACAVKLADVRTAT